ncbi:MAG: hypothetical protein F4Z15_06290, partial [Gammaproteobacteria bacterium]|nr:hypothetical protein [Gammaproteobacteria bacterium]
MRHDACCHRSSDTPPLTRFLGCLGVLAALNPFAHALSGSLPASADAIPAPAVHTTVLQGRSAGFPGAVRTAIAQSGEVADPRERFIQEYQRYREKTEPRLEGLNLEAWAPASSERIADLVDSAVERFQSGDYLQAYADLVDASERVDAVAAEYEIRLSEFVDGANRAYREGKAREAGERVAGGLRLDPDHAGLIKLESRVRVLEGVNSLLMQADHARAENRTREELSLLGKILEIDPQHGEARKRVEDLEADRLHRDYADAVYAAHHALDIGDLAEAKRQLSRAVKLVPENRDTEALQERISELETEHRYYRHIASAAAASGSDDWHAAVGFYRKALETKPFDEYADEGLADARNMIGMIESLAETLRHERRLSTERAVGAAHDRLAMAEPYLDRSGRLKALHAELSEKLLLYA